MWSSSFFVVAKRLQLHSMFLILPSRCLSLSLGVCCFFCHPSNYIAKPRSANFIVGQIKSQPLNLPQHHNIVAYIQSNGHLTEQHQFLFFKCSLFVHLCTFRLLVSFFSLLNYLIILICLRGMKHSFINSREHVIFILFYLILLLLLFFFAFVSFLHDLKKKNVYEIHIIRVLILTH